MPCAFVCVFVACSPRLMALYCAASRCCVVVISLFSSLFRHRLGVFPSVASGIGRFFNGARTPAEANVVVRRVLVDGKCHLVMIALRDIEAGEELIWYYGAEFALALPAAAEQLVAGGVGDDAQ